jgi:outer membrane cobalamin receptor
VGWLLQNQVTKQLALGAEVFHQTADTIGGKDTTSFNVGGIYDFNENYHLLFSGGRGLQNPALTNQFSYYLAIQWTH